MDQVATFLLVIDAYEKATNTSDTTASSRIFADSKKIAALRGGADIHTRRLIRALQWLSDNWPEGGEWPEQEIRPAPTSQTATAAQ